MKEFLKRYCIWAYETSWAWDNHTCATGFQLGLTDPERHHRNNEREKYREKLRLPENLDLLPAAVFTVGVTWRLAGSLIAVSIVQLGAKAMAALGRIK